MKRVVRLVGLRPEKTEQYLELHRAVWPEVQQRLRDCHITNYSIHRRGDLLISYFDYTGEDYDADMAAMAADAATQRWWQLTDPCQYPLPGTPDGALWADAEPLWQLTE